MAVFHDYAKYYRDSDNTMPRPPLRSLAFDLLPNAGIPLHSHRRHQFAVADGGAFSVVGDNRLLVVAKGQGVFIPAGMPHAIGNRRQTRLYGVYLHPAVAGRMPETCAVCGVSALLRELVRAAAGLPNDYDGDTPAGHLVALIMDQLAELSFDGGIELPMPQDRRLKRIAKALIGTPGDRRSLVAWSSLAGASPRTLLRLFQAETGMSFTAWRARLRIATAVGWLAEGRRIGDVAFDLGYESSSAFVAMFRRITGSTPSRYLTEHAATEREE